MPRVSLRRFIVYATYTAFGTWLIIVLLYISQQSALIGVVDTPPKGSMKRTEEFAQQKNKNDDQKLINKLSGSVSNTLRRRGLPWYIKKDGYKPFSTEKMVNIWPGRFTGDRIENQLMIPYSSSPDAPIKTIFLPNGLDAWWVKDGRKVFLDNQCPVDRCSLHNVVK